MRFNNKHAITGSNLGPKSHRSVKLKLYPNAKQKKLLKDQLGIARWVYNHFLALRIRHYKIYGKHKDFKTPSLGRLSGHLSKIKQLDKYAWLNEGCSWSLQAKLTDLDDAYKGFFNHKRGFPKFRSGRSANSMRYGVIGGLKVAEGDLRLPKLGKVKYRGQLRNIESLEGDFLGGRVMNITIKKHIFSRVDVTILYEVPRQEIAPNGVVGLDLNAHNITDNAGNKYDIPAYFFRKDIRYWQKTLARRVKGSHRYKKAREILAKWCYKSKVKRHHTAHKISNMLVMRDENQARMFVLEDMNLSNMTRKGKGKRGLNRSLRDSGLGAIRHQLEYKSAGVYKIDRWFPSSKLCSACGTKNTSLTLSDRVWECDNCLAKHDRDINAAVNIYNKWAEDALRGDGVRPHAMREASAGEARSS